MISRLTSTIIFVLLLPFTVQQSEGKSLKSLKPMEGIDNVALTMMLGGPLSLSGGGALRLFQGNVERAREFRRDLKMKIADVLHSYGVDLVPSSEAVILVDVFGRPLGEPDESHHYMFFLRVSLPLRNPTDSRLEEDLVPRTVIDVTAEEDLEVVITKSVLSILKTSLEEAGKESAKPYRTSAIQSGDPVTDWVPGCLGSPT